MGECRDCWVLPSETILGPHRHLMQELQIKQAWREVQGKVEEVIHWWGLQSSGEDFRSAPQRYVDWDWEGPVNDMWAKVASQLQKCGEMVLG